MIFSYISALLLPSLELFSRAGGGGSSSGGSGGGGRCHRCGWHMAWLLARRQDYGQEESLPSGIRRQLRIIGGKVIVGPEPVGAMDVRPSG